MPTLSDLHKFGFTLLVYEPPVTGSPWLVVCIRPPTDIVAVESYLTGEAANRRVAELIEDFVSRIGRRH